MGNKSSNKVASEPTTPVDPRKTVSAPLATAHEGDAAVEEGPIQPLGPIKIVLLGIGGVGKSTVFKQAKRLFCDGFTPKDRIDSRQKIISQMIRTLVNTIKQGVHNQILEPTDLIEESLGKLEDLPEIADFNNADYVANCKSIVTKTWSIPEIKTTLATLLTLTEGVSFNSDGEWAAYFLDKADQILDVSYELSDDDMLKLRRETNGSQSVQFPFGEEKQMFEIVDLGGQVHERVNWGTYFSGASAVIYMLALTDYDQSEQVGGVPNNKLQVAFDVFKEVVIDNPIFKGKPVVVLFNKMDAFQDKITKSPWNKFNTDWDPDMNEYDLCLEDLTTCYQNLEFPPAGIKVYPTCATDTKMIRSIMELVFGSILKSSLSASFA